jgi:ABC-type multidrug transport system fused ATPase/permease subunit
MPHQNNYEEYQNINAKKGFPRSYWFSPIIRWFTVFFSVFAIAYALRLIFTKINADSSTFTKLVPFLIIFFALNSLLRNLFTLNRLRFKENCLEFHYLMKKTVIINWTDFISIKLRNARQRILDIKYKDHNGNTKTHELTLAFPKMLEILNAIIEMTPQIALDEFMNSIVIAPEKEEIQNNNPHKENA